MRKQQLSTQNAQAKQMVAAANASNAQTATILANLKKVEIANLRAENNAKLSNRQRVLAIRREEDALKLSTRQQELSLRRLSDAQRILTTRTLSEIRIRETAERAAAARSVARARNGGLFGSGIFNGGRGGGGGAGGNQGGGRGGGLPFPRFGPFGSLGPQLGTAYFRGELGGAAIYSRLPVSLGGVTTAAALATAAVLSLGAAFDKTLNSVKVFGQTTETEAKKIGDAAIQMSRRYTTSANNIGKAAVSLAKAGAPVSATNTAILESVIALTEASQGELQAAESADILTQTIRGMRLEWGDTTSVVDTMVGVIQNSVATFDDLRTFTQQLVPIAGAVGFSYEELAVTFGVVRNAGLGSSVAATALKNAMLAIADPTSEAREILVKYGISLFDAQGKALPLIEIISRLSDAFSASNADISDAQRFFEAADIANTRQILAILSLATQGRDAYIQLANQSRVSAQQIAQDLQNNVIAQLQLMGNEFTAKALLVANEFTPTLTRALSILREEIAGGDQAFSNFGKRINEIISFANQDVNNFIINVAGLVAFFREAVVIMIEEATKLQVTLSEKFAQLSTDIKKAGEDAKIATTEFAETVETSLPRTSSAITELKNNFADLFNLAARVLKNTAIIADAAVRIVVEPQQAIAALIATTVNWVDTSIANIINILNRGIRSINKYLSAIATISNVAVQIPEIAGISNERVTGAFQQARADIQAITDATGKLAGAAGELGDTLTQEMVKPLEFAKDAWERMSDASQKAMKDAEERLRIIQLRINPPLTPSFDEVTPGRTPAGRGAGATTPPRVSGSTHPPASGGGGADKLNLDELTAQVRALLSDVPGLREELFRFIAGLAQDVPARLMPMVNAIKEAKGHVGGLILGKEALLETDRQLAASAKNLANLQAQQGKIEIQQALAIIGYQKQLLGIRHQQLEIDRRMWPIRDRLKEIDREIARINQRNWEQEREFLRLRLEALPIEREIERIEKAITDAVDRRQELLSRREEIGAETEVENLQRQLEDTEDSLEDAWKDFDVPRIIRLEETKEGLQEALEDAEKKLRDINAEQDKRSRETELRQIELELERLAQEDILKPIREKIDALEREREEKELLNQITISFLEEEREKLQLLLQPLEDQREALERITAEINLAISAASLEYEERKIQIQEMILQEQLRQAELQETRRQQEELFQSLVEGFIDAITSSQAFTLEESLEVAKRAGLWDDQVGSLIEIKIEFQRIRAAADEYRKALDAIPRNIDITVTTHYKTEGTPGTSTPDVPGPTAEMNANSQSSLTASGLRAAAATAAPTIINQEYNYNVNATYSNAQSPASVREDLRAMVMLAQK